jgi:ABC-type glycerol-3-phosphate transport system permease component
MARQKVNRSVTGNIAVIIFLAAISLFMVIPLVYQLNQAFKPLDEFFLFPPRLFVQNPTLNNFRDLFSLLANSWVPFSRYMFNSIFMVVVGTGGHVLIASLAAYPLAKHHFPGQVPLFAIIVLALMFAREVTQVPNFIIMTRLGMIDTYWAMLIPALIFPLGLFLMKQFMEGVPDSLLESARISGASEWRIWWSIVMPMVKPAWLTLFLFNFQYIWGEVQTLNPYILSEEIKGLPLIMVQLARQQVGAARIAALEGIIAAVYAILLIVPVAIFLITQSSIIETMGSSGLKE